MGLLITDTLCSAEDVSYCNHGLASALHVFSYLYVQVIEENNYSF